MFRLEGELPGERPSELTAGGQSGKVTRPSFWRVMNHEEDISTQQSPPEQETRIPGADAHPQRAQGPGGSSAQGPPPAGRLKPSSPRSGGRLRRREEFQAVYRQGLRVRARWMVVFARRREEPAREIRFGITASRKVGGAVRRSRCKRRIRELYRLYGGPGPGGVDLVVNAVPGMDRAPWDELVEDYLRCLRTLASWLDSPSPSSGSTNGGSHRRSRRRAGTSQRARNTLPRRSYGMESCAAGGWASRGCYGVIPSMRAGTIRSPERT